MDKSRLDDGTVLVAFELPAAVTATSVSLVGDFNDWSPTTHPLALLDDGRFRTEVSLPAGRRFRFRYLLDGRRWENDWAADDYVSNGLGADDSVVDLTAFGTVPTDDGTPSIDPMAAIEPVVADGDGVGDAPGVDGDGDRATPSPKRRWWPFRGRRTAPAGA